MELFRLVVLGLFGWLLAVVIMLLVKLGFLAGIVLIAWWALWLLAGSGG